MEAFALTGGLRVALAAASFGEVVVFEDRKMRSILKRKEDFRNSKKESIDCTFARRGLTCA
jgi:hypothetical protein